MAGRQKHLKKPLTERSKESYKNKLIGVFSIYAGRENAEAWVTQMKNNYDEVFANIYHAVHNSPEVTSYLEGNVGPSEQFIAYQIINETTYAVLLTKSEMASTVLDKYTKQGMPEEVVKQIMIKTANAVRAIVPSVASGLGSIRLDAKNVIKRLDEYVASSLPLPNSYAGVRGVKSGSVISPIYAGAMTFSEDQSASKSLDELRKLVYEVR